MPHDNHNLVTTDSQPSGTLSLFSTTLALVLLHESPTSAAHLCKLSSKQAYTNQTAQLTAAQSLTIKQSCQPAKTMLQACTASKHNHSVNCFAAANTVAANKDHRRTKLRSLFCFCTCLHLVISQTPGDLLGTGGSPDWFSKKRNCTSPWRKNSAA